MTLCTTLATVHGGVKVCPHLRAGISKSGPLIVQCPHSPHKHGTDSSPHRAPPSDRTMCPASQHPPRSSVATSHQPQHGAGLYTQPLYPAPGLAWPPRSGGDETMSGVAHVHREGQGGGSSATHTTHLSLFILLLTGPPPPALSLQVGTTDRVVTMSCVQPSSGQLHHIS